MLSVKRHPELVPWRHEELTPLVIWARRTLGDEDIYEPGILRTIYDPACGTGGMLSVSEEYIREHNPEAHLTLYGQDYNPESCAICCSDMLIKDEPADNIQPFDTLNHTKNGDPFAGKTFHYMMANPPFGVESKPQQKFIEKEHEEFGFDGRFGPGLPRINDGKIDVRREAA